MRTFFFPFDMAESLATPDFRRADAAALDAALEALRGRTLALFGALRAALGDRLEIAYGGELNPPRWELGHVGWFEEFWLARHALRHQGEHASPNTPRAAPLLPGADALYDSSRVAHTKRWHLDLPDAQRTRALLARIRERTRALLAAERRGNADALYLYRLVLAHEAMHHEAAAMIAQCLGVDLRGALPALQPSSAAAGELRVAGARFTVGERETGAFQFDNELGVHDVELADFSIDAAPVTWGAWRAFHQAGGYADAGLWTAEGWAWRQRSLPLGMPRHVAADEGFEHGLKRNVFGRWESIDLDAPAVHLGFHEAQAWCRWAGRRLPTEHEWTLAQRESGFAWGEVWEWTASPFVAWPGFQRHAYRDYSAPWFDGRPVLKGGSFATQPFMKHPRYRNYFEAHRNDVFAGFRSCAAQSGR
jgi:gamma-glutamyl hercynylcysteine S-oxide synthase